MSRARQLIDGIALSYLNGIRDAWRGYELDLLIEIVRSLDYAAFLNKMYGANGDLASDYEIRRRMLLGAATALTPLLREVSGSAEGIPWEPSDEQSVTMAEKHLLNCGTLAYLRRVIDFEKYGLATARLVSDDYLVIDVSPDEAEVLDRESASWLQSMEDERHVAHDGALVARKDEIAKRLDAYVGVDFGWFIRYGSDEEVLDYHMALASASARGNSEAEALASGVLLGGRQFGDWTKLSVTALGRVLHHVACATRLAATNRSLDLRNLLTVFARKEDVADVWGESNESIWGVNSIMDLMTLNATESVECELEYEVPLPFYIDAGREFLLLPVFGALLNPHAGLVRRLRREYRRDWDRGVILRENAFRDELRRVLPASRFEIPDRGFSVRRPDGSELTDIDAVILDRQRGTLVLVQLKWPDIFGRSLKERNSKMLNLLKANEWVERVYNWVGGRNSNAVSAELKLAAGASELMPKILVLSRYAARFSGGHQFDPRALWISWPEFLKGLYEGDEDWLFSAGRKIVRVRDSPRTGMLSSETFSLPGLRVDVRLQGE